MDHAGRLHFDPQVVPLASALPHSGEHGNTTVLQGDIVDQLHDDNGLAHAGAAKQARLAAFQVRLDKVHNLKSSLKHLQVGVLVLEVGRMPVDGQTSVGLDGT